MYTYEFKQVIEERGFEHWAGIQLRSVYKAMEALVTKGYLTGMQKIHPNTNFVTVYEVNDAGKCYLKKLVEKAFYSNIGQTDIWLAIAFMFATTRKFALEALQKRKKMLLEERKNDEHWMAIIEQKKMHIPTNYQGLIKMGYEISFLMEKRLDEWIYHVKNGTDIGYFLDEREGPVCE
jgi:DNA-binding PadR family transcriptional regulator